MDSQDTRIAEPPLTTKCNNCLGTGTVFKGKTFKAASKQCPVCKGTCKVPYQPKP